MRGMFDQDKANQVLERVANGESASKVCREVGLNRSTFYRHLDSDQQLRDNYARAEYLRAEYKADEIDTLADRAVAGEIDHRAAAVAIDAKKWSAAILNRAKFGQASKVELTGKDGADLFAGQSKDQLRAEILRRMSNPDLLRALTASGVLPDALQLALAKPDSK